MGLIPTQPFLGFKLAHCTQEAFLAALLDAVRARHAAHATPWKVAYLNAATVNLAFEDPEFAGIMAAMDCLYADGQAVVWASHRLHAPIEERVNAGDFTRRLVEALAAGGLKLALIGGRAGEAERAAEEFQSWAPALQIVMTHDGFFAQSEADALCEALDAADPDLVLLGMGSPKQERCVWGWAAGSRPRGWWCVGALFEYYAGTRRRAPVWMRRAGLEWLFRLALEPRRLWRRYLIGNPLFVWRVLRGRPAPGASPMENR